ncbi:MAG: recombination protein NinG [Bacteroidales bacterium]|nr:recombination protein NinG [Bacteroidales bacterium]
MTVKEIQKYSKYSVPELLKIAVRKFNSFIRKRDCDGEFFTCISCQRTLRIVNYARGGNYHAGHYYPSTESLLRFNEINVNGQCGQCNTHKHGNQIEYRKGLIKKYGIEEVERLDLLDAQYKRGFKWDRFTLIEIIEKYKK